MAIITTGNSFNPTDTVTSAELNNIANAATFDDPVDGTSLELKLDGKLGVKDAGVTPAKLSTGAPSWNASGAFLTSNVTAPESANSLFLRSDPETPGTGLDGGSQIRLFSSDSDFPDQVYYRGDFHTFNNIAGDLQGSIPYAEIPTLAQHFTRKDYVDEYALTYSGATGTFSTTAGTFVDLDLSSIVGSNRALVILEVYDCSVGNGIFYRTKGSTLVPFAGATYTGWGAASGTLGTSDNGGTVVVMTDQNGIMQHRADSTSTGVKYTVQAFQKLLIP
jgi:hypothetical protein